MSLGKALNNVKTVIGNRASKYRKILTRGAKSGLNKTIAAVPKAAAYAKETYGEALELANRYDAGSYAGISGLKGVGSSLAGAGKAFREGFEGTDKAAKAASYKAGRDGLWNAGSQALDWAIATDRKGNHRGLTAAGRIVGGAAALDFMNPFGFGWND